MSDRVFERGERQSAVWMKLKKHLEAELQRLRAKNDSNLDEQRTAILRGRIGQVKAILALENDAPPAPDEDKLFKD
jgi:hypothetical protein